MRYLLTVLLIIIGSINSISAQKTNSTELEKIKQLLKQAKKYTNTKHDSALILLKQAEEQVYNTDSIHWYYETLNTYTDIYISLEQYDVALDYLYQKLNYLDKTEQSPINDTLIFQYSEVYNLIGSTLYNMVMLEKSIAYVEMANKKLEELKKLNSPLYKDEKYVRVLNNIAAYYIQTERYEEAIEPCTKAIELNSHSEDYHIRGYLYNKMAVINYRLNRHELSRFYYKKAVELRKSISDTLGLISTYNNLGMYYESLKSYTKAISCFDSALILTKSKPNVKSSFFATKHLANIYEDLGQYEKSTRYLRMMIPLKDSLFKTDKINNINKIEAQYSFNLKKKELEHQQQQELAQKKRTALISNMIAIGTVFLLAIAVLIILLLRNKIRHAKLKEVHLQNELETKNKELTTNILYLLKKNEFITDLAQQLLDLREKFSDANQPLIQGIIKELTQQAEDDTWKEFEVRFLQVHNDFYTNLSEACPELTPNERKLCAFLRLNMSTKEISAITMQSATSINAARYRMRKKLGVDRDENLVNFLSKF